MYVHLYLTLCDRRPNNEIIFLIAYSNLVLS